MVADDGGRWATQVITAARSNAVWCLTISHALLVSFVDPGDTGKEVGVYTAHLFWGQATVCLLLMSV